MRLRPALLALTTALLLATPVLPATARVFDGGFGTNVLVGTPTADDMAGESATGTTA